MNHTGLPDIYCVRDASLAKKKQQSKKKNKAAGCSGEEEHNEKRRRRRRRGQHSTLIDNGDDSSSSSSESSQEDEDDEEGEEEGLRGINSLRRSSSSTPTGGGKSKGWKLMRRHLKKGTLLLNINADQEEEDDDDSYYSSSSRSRKSIRQTIANEFQEGMHFSIRFCLLTILAYLVLSIAMYTFVFEPTWTVIDSCYFAVTTFTTLGYGDLAPTNMASLIFTCIFALMGVAFLGLTLGVLGNRIIEKHDALVEEVEIVAQEQVLSLFGTMPDERVGKRSWFSYNGRRRISSASSLPSSIITMSSERGGHNFFWGSLGTTLCGGGSWNWQRFVWLCLIVLIWVSYISVVSGWGVMETIYFLIVTSCTIGYGDFVPTTQTQRLVAVICIPVACLIMGHWLGYVAHSIIEVKSAKFRKKRLAHRELTQDDLDAMDVDGDGKVSWAEFLEFMLVAMEKVDYELIGELQTYFRQLDVAKTGELSREDLVEAARRKLKGARRKLELAAYKRRVVNLGKFKPPKRKGRHHRRLTSFPNMLELTLRNLNLFGSGITENTNEQGAAGVIGERQPLRLSFLKTASSTASFRHPPRRSCLAPKTYSKSERPRVSFVSSSNLHHHHPVPHPDESCSSSSPAMKVGRLNDHEEEDDEESNKTPHNQTPTRIETSSSSGGGCSPPSSMLSAMDYQHRKAIRQQHAPPPQREPDVGTTNSAADTSTHHVIHGGDSMTTPLSPKVRSQGIQPEVPPSMAEIRNHVRAGLLPEV